MQKEESVQSLYKKWQRGDSDAGDAMADRFELWFHALSIFHLGINNFKSSYEQACTQFSNEILNITKSSDLIPFAYKILRDKIKDAGGVFSGSDSTNAMLQNRSPQTLVHAVWNDLSSEEQRLFRGIYGNEESLDSIKNQLPLKNGLAYACLSARQRLKRLLQSKQQVTFSFMDDASYWDLCPLPLFEANQLNSHAEYQQFERWLLSVPAICKDIIEFAPFIHTIKNGALQRLPSSLESAVPEEKPHNIVPPQEQAEEENWIFKAILLGVLIAVIFSGLAVLIVNLGGS